MIRWRDVQIVKVLPPIQTFQRSIVPGFPTFVLRTRRGVRRFLLPSPISIFQFQFSFSRDELYYAA